MSNPALPRLIYLGLLVPGLLLVLNEAAHFLVLSRTAGPVQATVTASKVLVDKTAFRGDVMLRVNGVDHWWNGTLEEAAPGDVAHFLDRFRPGVAATVYPVAGSFLLGPGRVARPTKWLWVGLVLMSVANFAFVLGADHGFPQSARRWIRLAFGWANFFLLIGLGLLVVAAYLPYRSLRSWPEVRVTFQRLESGDLDRLPGERVELRGLDFGSNDFWYGTWEYESRPWSGPAEVLLKQKRRIGDCELGSGKPCLAQLNPANPRDLEFDYRWEWLFLVLVLAGLVIGLPFTVVGLIFWLAEGKKSGSRPIPRVA